MLTESLLFYTYLSSVYLVGEIVLIHLDIFKVIPDLMTGEIFQILLLPYYLSIDLLYTKDEVLVGELTLRYTSPVTTRCFIFLFEIE